MTIEMRTLNKLPTGKKKEEPGRRVKRLAAEVSLGLIPLFLLIISRRFNWRENIVLLILALGLFRGRLRLTAEGKTIEFHPVLFMLLFFVTGKLALPLQAHPLSYLTLALFGSAVFCLWWAAGWRWSRCDRDHRLSQQLGAAGVVVMTILIFLILKILGGDKYGTSVSLFTLFAILFLFVGSYLISALSGKLRPFSRPIQLLWVMVPLIVVGINTARGWAAWQTTQKARTLNRAGDHGKALAAYRRAEKINSSLEILPIRRDWLLAEAREEEKRGETEAAISFYRRAVAAGTSDPELLLHVGDLYLERQLDSQAYRMYVSAGKHAEDKSEVRKALAQRFVELKRYPEAVEQLDRFSHITGVEQNLEIARVYERKGDLENAAAYLSEALRHNRSNQEIRRSFLESAAGQLRDALRYTRSEEEIDRSRGEINYALGLIYKQLNNYSLSEIHLRQALTGHPPIISSHFLLGQIYEESDPPAAVREYRQLVTKLPNHIDGLKRLRELLKREENIREGDPRLKSLDSRIAALIPSIPVEANLENEVMFLGYDLSPVVLKRGEPFTITYYWKGLKKMSRDYRVYVHFDNALHTRVRFQYDHEPLGGERPTSTWKPGCVIKEEYELVVPENVPRESYLLRVGMFDARGDKHNLKPIDAEGKIDWGLICQDNTNRLNAGSVIIK